MATWQHLRSSTANKRPTTSLADGRIAINTNTASPGLFFKDSAGTGIVKVGPVHVGTTAPNSVPASGGSTGNYTGEQWLDTSVSPAQMKVWNGSTWVGIVADELPVSKLQDGAPRQLIQTDAAGTGVEWTSDVDVPGTLDVTSTATFDSIAQHPLGSAGAPTITFTGDTNTGIYSPGADQVAVATGGSGRLFVDADGEVGIGTSSPDGLLTLAGANSNVPRFRIQHPSTDRDAAISTFFDGSGTYLLTGSNHYLNSAGSNTKFDATTGSSAWYLDGSGIGIFYNSSGSGSITERLRITAAGLVGVGTSTPSNTAGFGQQLEVAGTLPCLSLNQNNAGFTTRKYSIAVNASGDFGIWDNTASAYRWYVNSSGSVGIGTTSVSSKLHVLNPSGGSGTTEVSTIERDNSGYFFKLYRNAGSGNAGGLIGADSLGTYFTGGHNTQNMLYIDGGNAVMQFFTNNSERGRFDSAGRFLVGTSSSSAEAKLIVQGGATASGGGFNIQRNVTTASAGSTIGFITFTNSSNNVGATVSAEGDGTWSAGTSHPTRLVFLVTADGASTPTEAVRISQNRVTQFANDIIPGVDNAYQVGQSGRRWSVVYAGTGSINTSDATLKCDVADLDAAELAVAIAIKGLIKKFKFVDAVELKGDNARIHVGVIAQEVKAAFEAEGLDAHRYGLFCEDELEDGTKRLGIRYDELLAFVIAAL